MKIGIRTFLLLAVVTAGFEQSVTAQDNAEDAKLKKLREEMRNDQLSRDGQIDFKILRDELVKSLWLAADCSPASSLKAAPSTPNRPA